MEGDVGEGILITRGHADNRLGLELLVATERVSMLAEWRLSNHHSAP